LPTGRIELKKYKKEYLTIYFFINCMFYYAKNKKNEPVFFFQLNGRNFQLVVFASPRQGVLFGASFEVYFYFVGRLMAVGGNVGGLLHERRVVDVRVIVVPQDESFSFFLFLVRHFFAPIFFFGLTGG
jgi:hypothetical protein